MDLAQISELLDLLKRNDVSEFLHRDGDHVIRLRLGPPPAPVYAGPPAAAPTPAPAVAPTAAAAGPAVAAPVAAGTITQDAPMVGTFYVAPGPGKPAFVTVGQHVNAGQPLCIIEAMKLMNQIDAEVSGTIVELLVRDAQAVEFGQPLFRIRPD